MKNYFYIIAGVWTGLAIVNVFKGDGFDVGFCGLGAINCVLLGKAVK